MSQLEDIHEMVTRVDQRTEALERAQEREMARLYDRLADEDIIARDDIPSAYDRYINDGGRENEDS